MFRALRREEGQGLVEYGLIMFMVVLVLVGGLIFFSDALQQLYGQITGAFGAM